MSAPERADPGELLTLAADLARRAGEIHREGRRTILRVSEKSSPFDLVTGVDREAEQAIVEGITRARPDDGILGEEGTRRDGTSGVRWIVDPLDGTANYVYGYPAHAASIGVEVGGSLVAGAVYDSARDVLYLGVAGAGATMNGEPIHVGAKGDPATALVATGFSFDPARRGRQGEVLARLLPRVRDVRRSGSASIDMCAVAAGSVDLYFEAALAPWDVAGGRAVAEGAAATVLVRELDGHPGSSVAAANPALLSKFLPLLRAAGLDFGQSDEADASRP